MSGLPNYYVGRADPTSAASDFNKDEFLVLQHINRISTCTLVKVVACTNTPGSLSPVGRVDVLPLVNQLTGDNVAQPHGEVKQLCYFRAQGGANAIINDPQAGDIGVAVFADRDISTVKATSQQSNPGSARRFDMADGIFFGVCLGAAPSQYITFTANGITIADKNGNVIAMTSSGIAITSAKLTNTGDIVAGQGGSDQVSLQNHLTSEVQSGSGQSGPPVPGT